MVLPSLLSLALAAAPSGADTWSGFRNDGGSRTTARDLPLTWSPTENVAWRIPTPGYGQSAPVVWKDHVYLTAIDGKEKETLHVLCFDAKSGKSHWTKTFDASQKGKNNPMMSRAAGTPVVDAAGVVAFFESGDLIALGHDGSARWQRSLTKEYGEFKNNHGLGSSPAQTEKTVLVLVDHQGPSYLLAVDKATGANVWKADRPQRSSWTSPVVGSVDGKPVAVVSSGGAVTAYDAATGKQLWEMDGLVGNTIPSPTLHGESLVVGASESPRKPDPVATAKSNCCIQLNGASAAGYEVRWQGKKLSCGTSSPLVHAGHVYLVDKSGIVNCLDLKTGEVRYSERLASQVWATPVGAGYRVYFFGKDGVTTVLKAGAEYEPLATNRLWSADDAKKRTQEAKEKSAKDLPTGKGPGGGPPLGKSEQESMVYSAVGDVVYGVAAVDGTFFLRTGTELICVRNGK